MRPVMWSLWATLACSTAWAQDAGEETDASEYAATVEDDGDDASLPEAQGPEDRPTEAEEVVPDEAPEGYADMDDMDDVEEEPEPMAEAAPMPEPEPVDEFAALESDDGYDELAVKKRVLPRYPDELEVLYGEQAVRCEAEITVDDKGAPSKVVLIDCPDGFRAAAAGAFAKWRFDKPSGGEALVRERTGFERKYRNYYPGVTYFRDAEEVTSDPDLPVLLKSGKMPKYPRAVAAGDDVCLVELFVDVNGNTKDPIVDECAKPYRRELEKVVKTWKWWWNGPTGDKKATERVLTEVVFRL